MKNLRRRTEYLRSAAGNHGKEILCVCLTGVLSVGLSLFFIYVSKLLIDTASGNADGDRSIGFYTALLVIAMACQLICDAVDRWNSVRVQLRTGNDLRHRVFDRILRSEWSGLAGYHTGDIVNRIERDVSAVVSLLTVSFPAVAVMCIQFLAAMYFFICLDVWLPLIIAGILPLFLLGSRFYMKRIYRYTSEIRQTDSRIQAVIQESLQQRTVIKSLEQDDGRVGVLDGLQDMFKAHFMDRTRFSVISRAFVSAAFASGYLAAFLWGIAGPHAGTVTFGAMAAFLQLVSKIQRPVADIARFIPVLGEAMASADRLQELESVPLENKERQIRFPRTPDIVMENISFIYPDGSKTVLEDFTCRIPAGSMVAVTGSTGRGKTTFIRLLLALIRPGKGQARLCTPEFSAEISPETRSNFTYVPQGNTLFSGTVRENLLMGNPEASEERMLDALHLAAAGFVTDLPEGLDTEIGEQALGLSEGQAQRIAIARALLRDSHIFLLDEATSALDEATERQLMENLASRRSGKTFIFVTHHAAVSSRCDMIIRL